MGQKRGNRKRNSKKPSGQSSTSTENEKQEMELVHKLENNLNIKSEMVGQVGEHGDHSPMHEVVDQGVESGAGDDNSNSSPEGKKGRREPMSLDDKFAILDGFSKANPVLLLRQLALLSNRAKPEFTAKITKDESTGKFSTSLVAHYHNIKITIPQIPTRSERFAMKIGSDLILSEIYGDEHISDIETLEIKELNGTGLVIEKDEEYAVEKEKEQQKVRDKKADRMVNRIQVSENTSDEVKAEKIAKVWAGKVFLVKFFSR